MKSIGEIRRRNKNTGFTLVEIIVSSLIFAIAAAGVFATVSMLKQPTNVSSKEVTAAFIGKRILEDLRTQVDANNWNTGELAIGTHPPLTGPTTPVIVNGISYAPSYVVSADSKGTSARKVVLNITW